MHIHKIYLRNTLSFLVFACCSLEVSCVQLWWLSSVFLTGCVTFPMCLDITSPRTLGERLRSPVAVLPLAHQGSVCRHQVWPTIYQMSLGLWTHQAVVRFYIAILINIMIYNFICTIKIKHQHIKILKREKERCQTSQTWEAAPCFRLCTLLLDDDLRPQISRMPVVPWAGPCSHAWHSRPLLRVPVVCRWCLLLVLLSLRVCSRMTWELTGGRHDTPAL